MADPGIDERAVSSVVGNLLLVAIVIILTAIVTVTAMGFTEEARYDPPKISVSHDLVDSNSDVGNESVRISFNSGNSIAAEQLLVRSTTPIDIAGSPDRNNGEPSKAEYFAEGGDQVNVGDSWDAGEPVYLIGDDLAGERIQIVWSPKQIRDFNPGYVKSDSSFVIAEFTVAE